MRLRKKGHNTRSLKYKAALAAHPQAVDRLKVVSDRLWIIFYSMATNFILSLQAKGIYTNLDGDDCIHDATINCMARISSFDPTLGSKAFNYYTTSIYNSMTATNKRNERFISACQRVYVQLTGQSL